MKKKVFLILCIIISLSYLECNTIQSTITKDYNTISNIDKQIDKLKINSNDSIDIIKQKKELIKTLQDAKQDIIKKENQNVKLEKENNSNLENAGIGKFSKYILIIIGLGIIAYIIKKIINKI